ADHEQAGQQAEQRATGAVDGQRKLNVAGDELVGGDAEDDERGDKNDDEGDGAVVFGDFVRKETGERLVEAERDHERGDGLDQHDGGAKNSLKGPEGGDQEHEERGDEGEDHGCYPCGRGPRCGDGLGAGACTCDDGATGRGATASSRVTRRTSLMLVT